MHTQNYFIYINRLGRALQGRYSCKAQGASPGLGIDTHFLSPKGAALTEGKTNFGF